MVNPYFRAILARACASSSLYSAAGGLEPAEPTIDAAARELEEETGYKCGKIEKLITIRTTVAFCNEKIDIYLARDLVKTSQNLDEDEYLEQISIAQQKR